MNYSERFKIIALICFIAVPSAFTSPSRGCVEEENGDCCDGYTKELGSCVPVCHPDCINATCVAPNICIALESESEEGFLDELISESDDNNMLVRKKRRSYPDYSYPYPYNLYSSSESIESGSQEIGNNGDCPSNYRYLDGIGCYHFSEDRETWDAAKLSCREIGGYLAEIDNEEENEAVKRIISTENANHHYLGATDRVTEGTWIWDHSGNNMEFSNWGYGEPNNYNWNQHCLAISGYSDFDFRWDDFYCDDNLNYVCETDMRLHSEPPRENEECPPPFFNIESTGCHFVSNSEKEIDWFSAKKQCQKMGGYLSTMDSEAEVTAVAAYIEKTNPGRDYYIGANDIQDESHWRWVEKGQDVRYAKWGYDEPNDAGNEDCVVLKGEGYNRGRWNDDECRNKFGYICETNVRQPARHRPGSVLHCPEGYKLLGDSCYMIEKYSGYEDWNSASARCRFSSGYLVEIDSYNEFEAIKSYLESDYTRVSYYTGGVSEVDTEDLRWTWSNSGKPMTPLGKFRDTTSDMGRCMALTYEDGWYWDAVLCSQSMSCICETDPIVSEAVPEPSETGSDRCYPSYTQLGSNCYYISDSVANWWTATEKCRHLSDGHLVSVESPRGNEDIRQYLLKRHGGEEVVYWMGAYDMGHEGRWYWDYHRKPIQFEDWQPGEPNNHSGRQHCAAFSNKWHIRFHWDDVECEDENFFICETPALD